MLPTAPNDARLSVRLPSELKEVIDAAAVASGQTVSDFTISTVVREARHVLEETRATRLSTRDRDRFLKALDDLDTPPNAALTKAAERYGRRRG